MAWIELHDTLPDHEKIIAVADGLKMDKDLVVGKLVRLWVWALNNREDGTFRTRDISTIAEVMRFKGKAQRLVDVLVSARLLDREEDWYVIHDWEERVGMLLEKREWSRTQARNRKRRQRDKGVHVTRDKSVTDENVTDECHACHAVTVPKPYLDEEEDYTLRGCARTREEYDRAQEAVQEAFEAAYARRPTGAEAESLARIAVLNGKIPLIGEAIRRAAGYGAKSVVPYVSEIIREWSCEGICTEDDLVEYDYLRACAEGREPLGIEPEEARQALKNLRQTNRQGADEDEGRT